MKLIMALFSILAMSGVARSSEANLSTDLTPKFSLEYYAEQSDKYFDTLDTYAPRDSKPSYSKKVIRWEWHPWLKLTGYKSWMMKLDYFLTLYPTKVINRVCQGFHVQPFGRCHVTFIYKGNHAPVDIYEEFTFNNQGEITFIEAWTDSPEYFPTPDFSDYWAQGDEINRMSTKVPGLGNSNGLIDRKSEAFKRAAESDPDLKDLQKRLKNPLYFWMKELFRFIRKK